jgi:lipooligosaccharide transport system permease protein
VPLGFLKVFLRHFRVWKRYWFASLVGNVGEPVLYIFAFGYGLGRFMPKIGELSYLEFVAPGLALSACLYTSAYECTFSTYTRLARQGTFDAILYTPVLAWELALGEIFWGAFKGLLAAGCMLGVFFVIGLVPSVKSLVLQLSVNFLFGFFVASLSFLTSMMAKSYDFFSYFFSLAVAPLFLFSGVFFPADAFGDGFRRVVFLSPLFQAIEVARFAMGQRLAFPVAAFLLFLSVCGISVFVAIYIAKKRLSH